MDQKQTKPVVYTTPEQDKENAIKKMMNFLTYIDIHRKDKYLCKINLGFKKKKWGEGFAMLDMTNDSEFGDVMTNDIVDVIYSVVEEKLSIMIDIQRGINKAKETDESN